MHDHERGRALALLPDEPAWVEARAALLADGPILAFDHDAELALTLGDGDGMMFVVGPPDAAAVRTAVGRWPAGSLVAAPQHAAALAALLPADWRRSCILVHRLADQERLPPDDGRVALLAASALSGLDLPPDLAGELADAAAGGAEIAALFDGRHPVAFCYAGALTETLWDVSIDTLPHARRRGYAGQCAAWLIRRWAARGKAPVWQAVTDNPASWRLALKLGFAPCAELAYFQAPEPDRSLAP